MAKKDIILKEYLSIPEIFADLFNGYLFDGKQILTPENLKSLDSTETVVIKNAENKTEAIQKYRDVIKKVAFDTEFVLLGVEDQMNIHYTMPIRNMLYDAITYTAQTSEIGRKHTKEKDLSGDEFLSKFSKTDKLIPIITLVIYYGKNKWDGSLDLYGMLKFPEDTEAQQIIKQYVPNYKLNFIWAYNFDNFEKFKTGLREIFGILKNDMDGKTLKKYVQTNHDRFSNLDEKTYDVIDSLINLNKYKIKKGNFINKKGGINMSQALEDIKLEGKLEMIEAMIKENMDINIISKVSGISIDKIQEIKNNIK